MYNQVQKQAQVQRQIQVQSPISIQIQKQAQIQMQIPVVLQQQLQIQKPIVEKVSIERFTSKIKYPEQFKLKISKRSQSSSTLSPLWKKKRKGKRKGHVYEIITPSKDISKLFKQVGKY